MTLRAPGMRRKRQENYIVPGPDWLWCLDGHDKLARYGIEIYGSVDAYSRKIIWFYVGVSNRTQVSVLHQYLHTIKTLGYCPNYLRTDRGRETLMMADAYYTPHKRGISEVIPRPEREEEDRLTQPTQKPDLAGETGTQGAGAQGAGALAAADTVALAEAAALALAQAEAEIETGPTRRSQRQRKAPTRQ